MGKGVEWGRGKRRGYGNEQGEAGTRHVASPGQQQLQPEQGGIRSSTRAATSLQQPVPEWLPAAAGTPPLHHPHLPTTTSSPGTTLGGGETASEPRGLASACTCAWMCLGSLCQPRYNSQTTSMLTVKETEYSVILLRAQERTS